METSGNYSTRHKELIQPLNGTQASCEQQNEWVTRKTEASVEITEEIQRGCPQGSSLGPILWLVIMEDWRLEIGNGEKRLQMDRGSMSEIINCNTTEEKPRRKNTNY